MGVMRRLLVRVKAGLDACLEKQGFEGEFQIVLIFCLVD